MVKKAPKIPTETGQKSDPRRDSVREKGSEQFTRKSEKKSESREKKK